MDKPVIRVPANLEGPAFSNTGLMSDGFANFVTRIGGAADRTAYGQYFMSPYAALDVDAAYRTSWFRKICDIPPFDETRAGRTWAGVDKEDVLKLDRAEKKLGLMPKIAEARILARKDGGSVILLSTGGNAARPLDETELKKIAKDGLKFITVLSRYDCTPVTRDEDPNSPTFNMPKQYRLRNSAGTIVDASRVIRFVGNPIRQQGYWDGWGESIWVELRNAVRHADQISAGISAMVDEAKLDVVKIKNLIAGMATSEYEGALLRRWQSAMSFKSINNTLLLDDTDSYEQKTLTFQGLPDILAGALMIMSGMADIPATRLLGRSPQGMNATGDSDMRNYYDRITAGQNMFLTPALTVLDEVLVRSVLGDYPDEINFTWSPLYSLDEKEAATVEKTFADAAKIYADTGLLPEPALAKIVQDGIAERGQWPGAEKAFAEAEEAGDLPPLLEEPSEADLAEEEARTAVALQTAADPAGAQRPKPRLVATNDARFTDATPRTLYVRRDVVNVAEITKWAKAQGFTDILPDLHVTIASSRAEIDWMKMGASWQSKLEIPAGGPRIVDVLGVDSKFYVLLFASTELEWRHQAAKEAGASWDFPEYQPHISIQKGGDIDVSKIEPYRGKIVLGAEIFEERKLD